METITIKKMAEICQHAVLVGLGDKKIMISDDDEGNGYHELFFAFTNIGKKYFKGAAAPSLPHGITPEKAEKEYIILG